MKYELLFRPGRIGSCRLKNRVIMAPMGNINMADPIGRPLKKMIDYFVARARGGTGLIITGLVPVSFGIDATVSEENDTTYFPRIDGTSRTRLSGWRDLTAGVHAYNARIFIQLTAGLGRVGSPEPALKGKIPRSASFNKNFYVPQVPHLPFSTRKIKKIVRRFGQAALNARVSGFDGIQLHGHEGYLMDQLTSAPWNRRKLGRYRHKFQFGIDVVREIKEKCGEDFPIIYRIDLTQALEEAYGPEIFKERFRNNERKIQEGLEFCKVLAEAGVDAFDVDKGCYDNWFYPHPPAYFSDIPYVEEMAGRLKKYFRDQGIDVPVIAVGKLGKPEVAEGVLKKGWADYIMLGRPLLADPYWPTKVKEGRSEEITHCIGDHEGCIHSFLKGGHPCCSVNPYTGFEDVKEARPAERIKKVAVVGAGPAGCEAARTAHGRGHRVVLYEQRERIGGQLIAGSNMEIKHDIKRYLQNLEHQLTLLQKEGLEIRYNTSAGVEELAGKYDAVICSTGLKPVIPPLEDSGKIPSVEARELLNREMILPETAVKIAVIGGGAVGCELAYSLAHEKGREVTVVEMLPDLMTGVVHANRAMLLWLMMGKGSPHDRENGRLEKPVRAITSARVKRITRDGVIVEANRGRRDPYTPWESLIPENVHNPFQKKLDPDNTEELKVEADYLVYAAGGTADDGLYYQLLEQEAAREIYLVGDARESGGVWEAVSSANEVARSL